MAIKLKDIYLFQDIDINLANKIIDNSRTIEVAAWEDVLKQWDASNNNAYIIKNWIAKVIIWDTLLCPYLSAAYWITSSRRVSEKSVSISGMEILSGFKNLSNNKSYFKGSIFVIPIK